MVENYFFIQPLLVDHLTAEMPELQAVITLDDMTDLDTQAYSPAAHVIYVGDDVGGGPNAQGTIGKVQTTTQLWAVIIAVYFGQVGATGSDVKATAGPLIAKMLRCVAGWQPAKFVQPLARGHPVQAHYNNGVAYFPFVFRASFVF